MNWKKVDCSEGNELSDEHHPTTRLPFRVRFHLYCWSSLDSKEECHMQQKWFLRSFRLVICLMLVLQCYSVYGAEEEPFAKGSQLPQFALPAPDSQKTADYLGLKNMEAGPVSNIGAKLILIEFLSVLCPHCHTNAPIINRLYKVIQDDAALAKDVKIIGICIGNNKTQIDAYKKNFKVPFPIFPDEDLTIAATVEVMATPTMVLVTKDGKVISSHSGVIQDFDGMLKELRESQKKL
jgi:thiol-disulfide isomerase/thioredoxin